MHFEATSQILKKSANTAGTYTESLAVSGPGGSETETKVDYITVFLPAPTGVQATDGTLTDMVRIVWNVVVDATRNEI